MDIHKIMREGLIPHQVEQSDGIQHCHIWLIFRREGTYRQSPMNLAEAATAMAYTGCQNQMVNILGLPFITAHNIGTISAIEYLVVIPLFTFFLPGAFTWVRGTTQTVILGLIMPTMAGCVYALFSDEA